MLALIPGRAEEGAFIQVVTNERAYNIPYPLNEYKRLEFARVGGSRFERRGVDLNISTDELTITGSLRYRNMKPISYDIMGPFKYLPMECRHSVISMDHDIEGELILNGEPIDFSGGRGYIEGDRGHSFPDKYIWAQCNCFDEPCSIMVALARIPFAGLKFWGCICVVLWRGKEYRLATYKGVRIVAKSPTRIELEQGKYRLVISLNNAGGHPLRAPDKGSMTRIIHESSNCEARFRFYIGGNEYFDKTSNCASFEYV